MTNSFYVINKLVAKNKQKVKYKKLIFDPNTFPYSIRTKVRLSYEEKHKIGLKKLFGVYTV